MELTKEDFDTLGLREKAIYELISSTGMTIDEVINLTFGDFVKSIGHYIIDEIYPHDVYEIGDLLHLQNNIVGFWEITDSITFSSHESIIAILDYLKNERDQCIPFDEPLFQCDYGGKLLKTHVLSIFKDFNRHLSNSEGRTK